MDCSKALRFGGLVVGFFMLGQALRSASGGETIVAAIEAVIAVGVLAIALQYT